MKVMGRSSIPKVEVRADGTGLSSRAGTALLPLAAERVGLTGALGWALSETRERRSAHDPGRVFCDLAVMLADGGRCVSDLVALRRGAAQVRQPRGDASPGQHPLGRSHGDAVAGVRNSRPRK